ncbi:MAG: porin [Deltaproteobacteria bacterium]|nr:porin [Deltaproteobacteria bacterium]
MKSSFRHFWSSLGIALGILALTQPALAKTRAHKASTQGPTALEYQQRLDELEQRQKILERNIELKDEQEKEKAKERPIVKAGPDGISISSADGNNELRFKGLLQLDGRFFFERGGLSLNNTFLARRVRPWIEGKFFKRFEFRIMPDFGNNQVVLQDAYINTVIFPQLKAQFGKYKTPFGIENLQNEAFSHWTERGLTNQLVPNRDLGVMLHGEVLDGVFAYQIGVFNGVPDNQSADLDSNNAKDFVGRVFAQPFKKTSIEPLQKLGFGVAGTNGHQSGNEKTPNLASYKTAGQNTFFSFRNDGTPAGTTVANGDRWRVSPQGYYYYKGLGILSDYVVSSQGVTLGPDSAQITNKAWQVEASYIFGADNGYGQILPRKPLGWKHGGAGAFEVLARYGELSVDKDAFPIFADPTKSAQKAKEFGAGFNWYINQNVKLMVDFNQTRFDGGAKVGNRPTEYVIVNRYQLYF